MMFEKKVPEVRRFGAMQRMAIIALAAAIGFLMACENPTSASGNGNPTVVNIAALDGLTAPETGATPVTAITPTAQYTGNVAWLPAVGGTFAASTAYTATITLTAKKGFTLQGVGANFFTVSGATSVSNDANSGVVTAVFPATGSGDNPPALDKAELLARIANAENLMSQVEMNSAAENVALGAFWVTQAVMSSFENAINTAASAIASATAQEDLDSAAAALEAAVETFRDAWQLGSKNSDFSAVQVARLIDDANGDKAMVHTSANGDDVSPLEQWVSQPDIDALDAAIALLENAAGQSAIDTAYLALIAARGTFNNNRRYGSTPDWDALNEAIASANEAKSDIQAAANAGEVALGLPWATPVQFAALDSAIADANAIKDNAAATKNAVSLKRADVLAATGTFIAAVADNGPGTSLSAKSVVVGTQSGTLTADIAGNATFAVTTANIASGSTITLNNPNSVTGITLETAATTGDSTNISISTTEATPAGSHSLSLTIDGTTSLPFILTVGSGGLPALTGTVSISGDAIVGQTLTVVTTSLGGDGNISYQWKRGETDIGTDSNTYVVVAADVGLTITVTVTREGYSGTKEGGPTAIVALPVLTGSVTISGTAIVGQSLTAVTTALEGSGTISFQWKRGDGTDIGTNGSTYQVVSDDIGATITVTVTREGYSGSKEGGPTAIVALPVLTGSVTISGDAIVGETLTAVTTSLDGTGTITYQWKRGETDIGTNNNIYVVVAADLGATITVTVTRSGYTDSKTSEPTATVVLPELTGTVSISGTVKVGENLTAVTTALVGTGTFSYQWKRNPSGGGAAVVIGTNSGTYEVQEDDIGSTITVTVTSSGNSGSKTSDPTIAVPELSGTVSISISTEGDAAIDDPDSLIVDGVLTLNRDDEPATLTLANSAGYDLGSIRWKVQNTGITGNDGTFTLNPSNPVYQTNKLYFVTVEALRNGIPFDITITFKVEG